MKQVIISALKGGVGKTTTTIGLARALAARGLKVGILDLDYRNSEVLIALGVKTNFQPGRTRNDAIVPPIIEGIAVYTMAFYWPPTKAVMVSDSDAVEDVQQLISPGNIAWPADLDYLICDSPPTSAGVTTAALASPEITGVLTITQPSSLSIAALLRTLDLFREQQVPVYGIVSNQGLDETGQARYDLADSDVEDIVQDYKLPLFQAIPHGKNLMSYYSRLAEKLISTTPVKLAPEEVSKGVAWNKLVAMARSFKR